MATNNYQVSLLFAVVNIHGIAPASVVFNPASHEALDTIVLIKYNFGDGESREVAFTKFPPLQNKSDIVPRFVQVAHTYKSPGVYKGTVTFYQVNDSTPSVVNFTITLEAAADLNLRLIKSAARGSANDLTLFFQEASQKSILPIVAAWNRIVLPEPITVFVPPTPSVTMTMTPTPSVTLSLTPTHTRTPGVTVTPSPSTPISSQTEAIPGVVYYNHGAGRRIYSTNATYPDTITITYNAFNVPDKYSFITSSGVVLATSGWVGSATYNADLRRHHQPNVSDTGTGTLSIPIPSFAYGLNIYIVVDSLFESSNSTFVYTSVIFNALMTEDDIFIVTEDGSYLE